MKTALIIPYFGNFPNYFQIFLDSCSYNKDFDWIIFSDDISAYHYPENVHLIKKTFAECQQLVQSKFDFPIVLHTPQKLCDYKCAYGHIFSDYLVNYDWWGHCDLDQIFGDLGVFISDEMLCQYDKIGTLGHLTLYRNTLENNTVFMRTDRYRQVFTTEQGCAFDEWLPGNINEIYLASQLPVYLNNCGADIHPYQMAFRTVEYDIQKRSYVQSPVANSIFLFDHGKLTQIYREGSQLKHRPYPYIHLQKRTMTDCRTDKASSKFYIVPNSFVDGNLPSAELLKRARLRSFVNTQFFKVKWKSLKYRLLSGNWNFNSVFKQ